MGNKLSLYFLDMLSSPSSFVGAATYQCIDKDKDAVDTPSLLVPMKHNIMYECQSDILLALSNYYMNIPGSKQFRIIKNENNATGRHIAIYYQQDVHNQEVNKFNKANKDIIGFFQDVRKQYVRVIIIVLTRR